MFVEKRFFEWDNDCYVDPVQLGDNIAMLIDSGIVVSETDNGELKYFLSSDRNISIGVSDGVVYYIYYTRSKGDKLIGVDAYDLPYPATEHICDHLAKRFTPIRDKKSISEMKETHKGDYLYVIFRDFIPTNLFIIRLN